MQFSPVSCSLLLHRLSIFLSTRFFRTLSPCTTLNIWDQNSYPLQTICRVILLHIFILYSEISNENEKKDTQQDATSHSAYLIRPYVLHCRPGKRSRYSDSLRPGRSGDRIPMGDEIFLTRSDLPWGPPSLLHNGYRISFSGVRRSGRGFDHPPHLAPRLKKE